MKFKMLITQEIINKSECGSTRKCAFATAYAELIPNVVVGPVICFYDKAWNCIRQTDLTLDQIVFMYVFDNHKEMVEPAEFEVEIPDVVISYWYDNAVQAARKIANSKILTPLNECV